jgi:dihydroorotate dehydrogenase (fumarate)
MDLSTRYLGLRLLHPLMPGASPLAQDLDTVRRLEDAGAAAIVMHSLFEEQLIMEQTAGAYLLDVHEEAYAEALSFFSGMEQLPLGPEEYLEQVAAIRAAVSLPVIASLNGTSLGGWLSFAAQLEGAGANALELNVYYTATDPDETAVHVEQRILEIVREVKAVVSVPVAVKLSPYHSAPANFGREVARAGADGLVLFNRFFQPEIDPETLQVARRLLPSHSSELLPRLRWTAILSGAVDCSLAISGGVQSGIDALKAVMSGAEAVQMVSALLKKGPGELGRVRRQLADWLERHEYDSLEELRGSMSLRRCPDPRAYERASYMEILQSWRSSQASD